LHTKIGARFAAQQSTDKLKMPNNRGKQKGKEADKRVYSIDELNDALFRACHYGILSPRNPNEMSVRAAIAAGADVNYSKHGWTCLMAAHLKGHAEIVAQLANAGAGRRAQSKRLSSPQLWQWPTHSTRSQR
jgi:ankyrin repeat protein